VPDTQSLSLLLQSGLVAAGCALPVVVLLALVWRRTSRRWFPLRRPWKTEWNGFGVFFCFLVYYYLQPLVLVVLVGSGFLQKLYGPDFLPTKSAGEYTQEQLAALTIASQWASVIAFPFLVWGILSILRGGNGLLPISPSRMPANLTLAYLFWLVVTPVCFGTFLLANYLFIELSGRPPEKHPATLFAPVAGTREWILFAFQVLVVAPTLEELLFRGSLLPWLLQRKPRRGRSPEVLVPHRYRASLIFAIAVAIALYWEWTPLAKGFKAGDWVEALHRLAPVCFVLALGPLLYTVPHWKWLGKRLRIRSPQQGKSIIASSILFAAVHSTWPTPPPLFFLSLGLGYLAVRTRNVAASIATHSLFNAVSVVYLLKGGSI
jgi:membrane protease YdiL (CAAX protease family)